MGFVSDPTTKEGHVDRTRKLGPGILSDPVAVFYPGKIMLLVGVGGGAVSVDPDIINPKRRSYWLKQQ